MICHLHPMFCITTSSIIKLMHSIDHHHFSRLPSTSGMSIDQCGGRVHARSAISEVGNEHQSPATRTNQPPILDLFAVNNLDAGDGFTKKLLCSLIVNKI
ncbi:hypothetical protein HanIR_Chr11g0552141 [Helianthus annuus]|nr:hypothetical protein HanIR_Chr11g0552141 [Helianthus annuus]